jgi:hypothetical protein
MQAPGIAQALRLTMMFTAVAVSQMDDLVMPVAVHDVRYIGFVDVADLVSAVLTSGLTYSKPTSWLGRLSDFFLEDTKHLVDSAVNLSGRDKFVAITTKDTLLQVPTDSRHNSRQQTT